MKATAERSDVELTGRGLIAAEVRAVLARKKLNSNNLPELVGRTQSYWYSRLNERVSFSADDLAALSAGLNVAMSDFVPSVIAPHSPDDNAPVDLNTRRTVRPEVIETPTLSVKYQNSHMADVLPFRKAS